MSEKSFTAQEICSWVNGKIANSDAWTGNGQIRSIMPLDQAGAQDLSFFLSLDYRSDFERTRAGVLVVPEAFVEPIRASNHPSWTQAAIVTCKDPYLAMAQISGYFHRPKVQRKTEVDSTADVSERASLAQGVRVGARSKIFPGVYLGEGVEVGEDCVLHPNVCLYAGTRLGNQVIIHAGTVIGADGFGYAPVIEGGKPVRHHKINHLGGVVIEDQVEIGANSCVDRGTFGDTRIGKGAKIDNHVQIGHNCTVGEGAIICGCTGIAGSAQIGRFVYLGGGSGVGNKVVVADHTKVAAFGLVSKDTHPGDEIAGNPMRTVREHFKVHALLNRMAAKRGKANE